MAQNTLTLELVSPEKVLLSQDVVQVTIPGAAGEFGVLAGHAPLLSSLQYGTVVITLPDTTQKKIFVTGGFADITGSRCAILAEEAVDLAELDAVTLEQQIKTAEDELGVITDSLRQRQLRHDLAVLRAKRVALTA